MRSPRNPVRFTLLNQLFGKGKEPFWQQAYTNLVRWIIELYRVLPGGWVTLRDVYHCAIDKALFAKKIQQAQAYAADMSDTRITIAATELTGDHLTPLRRLGFQPNPADLTRFQTRADPGQPLAQADPAAGDQALVADESPAAAGENRRPAGEARQILLAPAGGRSSEPAALRRDAAEDLGAAGAGRLTRGRVQRRLAKKGHRCGAVSEKCPESSGSGRFHVSVG